MDSLIWFVDLFVISVIDLGTEIMGLSLNFTKFIPLSYLKMIDMVEYLQRISTKCDWLFLHHRFTAINKTLFVIAVIFALIYLRTFGFA